MNRIYNSLCQAHTSSLPFSTEEELDAEFLSARLPALLRITGGVRALRRLYDRDTTQFENLRAAARRELEAMPTSLLNTALESRGHTL